MLQNLQPRVHRFPSRRKVAVPWFQHSYRFGQAALSQTVWSSRARTRLLTDLNFAPVDSGTLNHGGSLRSVRSGAIA
jgi:hypothetical protein